MSGGPRWGGGGGDSDVASCVSIANATSPINRCRRHLTSSQAAAAEAKRAKLDDEYARELERQRAEAKSRIGTGRPAKDGNSRGRIPASSSEPRTGDDAARTNTKRAKSAGTNRKYLESADRILTSYPQVMDRIESGGLSIPEANAICKQVPHKLWRGSPVEMNRREFSFNGYRASRSLKHRIFAPVSAGVNENSQSVIGRAGERKPNCSSTDREFVAWFRRPA